MSNEVFYPHYEKLLAQEYHFWRESETKPVWRWIKEKRLTVCPAFVGSLYEKSKLRLMVVGRAVNGWDKIDTEKCTSLKEAVEAALQQEDCFNDVVNADGIPYVDSTTGEKKKYFYNRSKFWKLIRAILEENGESEDFNKKIVWSNLYKVAPFVTGNPGWSLIKPQMETHMALLLDEIRAYRPTHILFITGMDYINPWNDRKCFGELLGVGKSDNFGDDAYRTGSVEGAKVVICGRPELKSDEDIRQMAKEILKYFGIEDTNHM